MLKVIPEDLRQRLKSQVYYSAEHFLEVFKELQPRLTKLPIPLHVLLEDATIDAAQAMKDMHRERITLDGQEVNPVDVTRLLRDRIHGLLEGVVERTEEGAPEPEKPPPQAAALAALFGGPSAHPPPARETEAAEHRQERIHAALTEHLVMRVINAASRTTSGGDSFFIVQDMYGGDGILVKQSAVTAPPIEIVVDESGVLVKSQDSYEIYHEVRDRKEMFV